METPNPGPGEEIAARPERPASIRPPTQSAVALWRWFKTAGVNFVDINGTIWSASFAYYAFFSLVPLLLLMVTVTTDVAARFVGEQAARARAFDYIVRNVDTYLPVSFSVQETIHSTVRGVMDARGKIGVVALVGLIWSGMGFFQSLVSAINQAWGHHPLNWWKLPLKNLLMLGVLLSALLLGVVVPAILKITFSMVWIPALLVTALLQACQGLFVFYTTHITNFNAIYGTFGGVIALMLWTYLSGMIIVFGGCLCAAQRQMVPTPDGTI